ncbi:MAG: hypothetical protein M1816_004435 [Peltula sp. TS41687]|nr:MAG: hypothetical protein M1816_004435 [Peltula sp. TS41687]
MGVKSSLKTDAVDQDASSKESPARPVGLSPPPLEDKPGEKAPSMSRTTTQSGTDEEAIMYTHTRMLQDPSGRLLYVGDSATLSFLQLMRMIVESVDGPSPFTTDPRRHRILENSLRLPQGLRYSHLLPDRKTANILVTSYLINTQGLLEVFDRPAFYSTLESSYSDPLSIDPSWLCLLNLVLAIGLVLASFAPGTEEAEVINKLRNDPIDRAEIFYLNAKKISDPISGFEEAGFWSIQALLLMTVYMLAVSKRNAAFTLFGMAVRSAFALGLHREETMVLYPLEERDMRRNLWRSLFVFDRFLSASMGRPMVISEDDCSEDILKGPEPSTNPVEDAYADISVMGLLASVKSAQIIGDILRRIYQKRKTSTRLAQEIADACKILPTTLAPVLHWRQAASSSPAQGIAILHVNLLYYHAIILLTRPFFLFVLHAEVNKIGKGPEHHRPRRTARRMERFVEACVVSSTHSITLIHDAYSGGYLPQRNPFVIYFLFAAALIVLSNEFSGVCPSLNPRSCIDSAITVMTYCAESDPQAQRVLYIMTTFRDVVSSRRAPYGPRQLPSVDNLVNSVMPYSAIEDSPGMILPDASLARKESLPGDLGNLTTPTGISEDSLATDEAIDFDTLWNWPTHTSVSAASAYHTSGPVTSNHSVPPLLGMPAKHDMR